MSGCAAVFGLLLGLILLIPGACVLIQAQGVRGVIILGACVVVGGAVIIWAAARMPPRSEYLLLEDQPARTTL